MCLKHLPIFIQNIVYGIICRQCNIIYMGETGRRFADRITKHIRLLEKKKIVHCSTAF